MIRGCILASAILLQACTSSTTYVPTERVIVTAPPPPPLVLERPVIQAISGTDLAAQARSRDIWYVVDENSLSAILGNYVKIYTWMGGKQAEVEFNKKLLQADDPIPPTSPPATPGVK